MEEIIVNGKNVLHPADFRRDKNELARIRGGIPSNSNLPYFKEKNWIFDANVKGEDINGLVTSLQSKLTTIHNTELGLTKVIDAFITAFESLDKNYLQGICIAVKAGQEADKQANDALERIKATLELLSQFKDELKRNAKHLNDIDAMWDDIQDVLTKCKDIETRLKKESELIQSTSVELQKFQKELSKVKHLADVDGMHTDLSNLKNWEKNVAKDLTGIHTSVDLLISYKAKIETIHHLYDIDELFEESKLMQNALDGLQDGVQNVQKNINAVETSTNKHLATTDDALQALQEKLSALQTSNNKQFFEINNRVDSLLKDFITFRDTVDKRSVSAENTLQKVELSLTEFTATVNESLSSKEKDISNLQENARELDKLIKDNAEETSNEIGELKAKLKNLYIALGGVAGVVIVQLILNIIGVL